MAKLWHKAVDLDGEIEQYTVGNDYVLDMELVEADVLGSVAHAKMLAAIGILTEEEFGRLKEALKEVLGLWNRGDFCIEPSQEDVHTAVEAFLTDKLGELGKKIHTGRSRNDQVLVDTRLYVRDRLLDVRYEVALLADTLARFAEKWREVPMPGRTHTQRAMPSSVGLWAGAFAESLADDLVLLGTAAELNDQCPLGSAASYGVGLPIDRQMTADLLGFAKVQNNVLYANNSRGKMEAIALFACTEVMHDLAKLANDLIFFSIPEMGYFGLPEEYCPGSSIMPQKKNPGPLELIRAKSAAVEADLFRVLHITRALPSGYNRDFQETKEPLMQGLKVTESSLKVARLIFENLTVNEETLLKSFTPELYAADEALEMAARGVPFRDAYKQVGLNLDKLADRDPRENILSKTHLGAPGNLGLAALRQRLSENIEQIKAAGSRIDDAKNSLLK
jgi:argininosuccinate lyase